MFQQETIIFLFTISLQTSVVWNRNLISENAPAYPRECMSCNNKNDCQARWSGTGDPSQYKDGLFGYVDFHYKIWWSWIRLIFIMGIPILVKLHAYFETVLGYILTKISDTTGQFWSTVCSTFAELKKYSKGAVGCTFAVVISNMLMKIIWNASLLWAATAFCCVGPDKYYLLPRLIWYMYCTHLRMHYY